MLLHTPPMPRPWQHRSAPPQKPPVIIDVDPEQKAPTFSPPPRPKLVTSSSNGVAGSIPKILHEILEPASGKRIEVKECHDGYAAQCRAEGKRAVPPMQFIDPMKQFCRRCGSKTPKPLVIGCICWMCNLLSVIPKPKG